MLLGQFGRKNRLRRRQVANPTGYAKFGYAQLKWSKQFNPARFLASFLEILGRTSR
jgi:hypothetical protein